MALARCTCPVICNGDLKTVDDCRAAMEQYPTAAGFMAGRGFLADPAMGRRLRGGGPITREELRRFNEELFDGYEVSFGGPGNAMLRMKSHWRYFILLLVEASVQKGEAWEACNRAVEAFIAGQMVDVTDQLTRTAQAFADDLVLAKAVQGLPLVGVLGGLFNPVCCRKVMKYAALKYRKRCLLRLYESRQGR